MDSQGPLSQIGGANPNNVSTTNLPTRWREFGLQQGSISPLPFFEGFPSLPRQMPFTFPHSFMPSLQGLEFARPLQITPATTIALTTGLQKRGSQECVTCPSTSTKKQRGGLRQKAEIVALDEVKDKVDVQKSSRHWKDHWVIQLITICGEMRSVFSTPPKPGLGNWSRVQRKLVSLCPDFTKDSEACRKKWSAIYNNYKEDKAMNLKFGCEQSKKCRWYQLVDEVMFDRANVVSHAHNVVSSADANAMNADGLKSTMKSDT